MQSPDMMTYHNECASVIKEKPTTFFDILIPNFKNDYLKKEIRGTGHGVRTQLFYE